MFLLQAPEVRDLDVFTTMPEHFRRRERSDWADANRGGTITDSFLEGPVFDDGGNLYVSDIPWGRVFRINPQGDWALVAEAHHAAEGAHPAFTFQTYRRAGSAG